MHTRPVPSQAPHEIRVVRLLCDYPDQGLHKGDRLTVDDDGTILLLRGLAVDEVPSDLAFALGQAVTLPLPSSAPGPLVGWPPLRILPRGDP